MDFILDEFVWSFSRANSFNQCPQAFYLDYITKSNSEDNVFGQFGTFGHSILEDWAKGKVEEYELGKIYEDNYASMVTQPFPPNKYVDLADKYYNQGLDYFYSFSGIDEEIIGVENKHNFKVGKYNFTGLIDLETKYKIIDHKSKSKLDKKRLTKRSNVDAHLQLIDGRYIEKKEFYQLYIYSIAYKNKHGYYPKTLALNMFKIQDWYEVKFDDKMLQESIDYMVDTIERIYACRDFLKGDVGDFWCEHVCGQKFNCKYSNSYSPVG